MTRPLRIATPESATLASREGDRVASWLSVMVGMIGAPDAERRGVQDELESHLRERVRDLMLSGLSETDATGRAIAELGDAAALAKRYQEAIKPSKRRLFMQVAAMSFAGAAAVLSVVAITGANQPTPGLGGGAPGTPAAGGAGVGAPPALDAAVELRFAELVRALAVDRVQADQEIRLEQFAKQDAERQRAADVQQRWLGAVMEQQRAQLAEIEARESAMGLRGNAFTPETDDAMALLQGVEVTLTPQTTWGEFFKAITPKGGTLQVRKEQFDEAQISLDSSVNLGSFTGTAAEALAAINATVCKIAEQEIGVRASGQNLIVGPAAHFDSLEQTLATYDLSPLIRQRAERTGGNPEPGEIAEEVSKLITSLVFPEQWIENGGERASVRSFESKLFIQAPRRFHPKVAWILGELGAKQEGNAMGEPARDLAPVADDVATLKQFFDGGRGAAPGATGPGSIQVDAVPGGRVRARGAGGEVIANQLHLSATGGAAAGSGTMRERLMTRAEGQELITVSVVDGKVSIRQGETVRTADVVEIEVPEGWRVQDEWDRSVVPATSPGPGGRMVTFTAPHGYLFGQWRRGGITGDVHRILPPGSGQENQPGIAPKGAPTGGAGGGGRGGASGGMGGGATGGAAAIERGSMAHVNSKQASYTLYRVKADEMRDLLGTVLNIVPRLKECPVPRTLGIAPGDGNVLEIGATTAQVHDMWTILAALDADVPADASRTPETKQFPLQHISAPETRELLGRWFNANATMKECAVTRMVAADANTNSVTVTATRPQVAAMGDLIAAMDAPK